MLTAYAATLALSPVAARPRVEPMKLPTAVPPSVPAQASLLCRISGFLSKARIDWAMGGYMPAARSEVTDQ